MSRYTDKTVIDEQMLLVQGSTIEELEKVLEARLASAFPPFPPRVITSIRPPGSGFGNRYTIVILWSELAEGLNPQNIQVRVYMGDNEREIEKQRAKAKARALAEDSEAILIDEDWSGGSQGLMTAGFLVYGRQGAGTQPIPLKNNLYWSQGDVWLNEITGDDNASGSSQSEPIKTFGEFADRLGDGFVLPVKLTLHLLTNLSVAVRLRGYCDKNQSVYLRITGENQATLYQGTVDSYTPPSVGVEGELTDAGVSDWTNEGGQDLRGKKIVFTSGDAINKYTFISSTSTSGVDTARVGVPLEFEETGSNPPYSTEDNVQNGDTFDVVTLYAIPAVDLDIERVQTDSAELNERTTVVIDNIHVREESGDDARMLMRQVPATENGAGAYVIACAVNMDCTGNGDGGARFVGCCFNDHVSGDKAQVTVTGGKWSFLYQVGGGVDLRGAYVEIIKNASYFEGGLNGMLFSDHSVTGRYMSFGVYDATGDGIRISYQSFAILHSNWGANISNYGVQCLAYAQFISGQKPTISGGVNDVMLGGNALAWANIPSKNVPPNNGGGGGGGTDTNDYHIIQS